MSDDPHDLTDAQSEAVRRALAAARHEGPVPPDVVARLDARLTELHAERAGAPTPLVEPTPSVDPGATTVVPAADRFRRRRWTTALAAAAAVTAVGLGSTQLLDRGADDRTTSADAARESAAGAAENPSASAPESAADSALLSIAGALTPEQQAVLADAGYTHIARDASTLHQLDRNADSAAGTMPPAHDEDARTMAKALAPCDSVPRDRLPEGAPTYTAERDGELFLLAVSSDVEGAVARVWPCAGGTPFTVRLD